MATDEDDEGLISLDFTVPGAFDPKPEPVAPEASPAAEPQPEPEPEPPPQPRRPPLPAPLREAAEMYAAGQELDAMRRLEAAIKGNEDLGDAAVRAWGGLFELLQVLGRRPAFDALALTFARRFEQSPPTWSPVVVGPHVASESSGGRAHVALTGSLNAGVGEVLKQAMKLATTSNIVRIDVAKLDDADNDGATLLMRALAALKRAKKEYVFGGPEHLAAILAGKLEVGERRDEAMWLLLLELHQQAYQQEAFDETAVNYAITFEVSPPSWEPIKHHGDTEASEPALPADKADGFVLRGQLLGAGAVEFAALEAALGDKQELDIDAHNLVRIDRASAGVLLDVLTRLHANGKTLRIIGLSPLVAAFMEVQGYADVAELRTRAI